MDWYLFEKDAWAHGFCSVCGVDEAGRGPLAGPVFAAAVILPADADLPGLNDSKKLTPRRREMLFGRIIAAARAYGVAQASVEEIESRNILGATFLAMHRALAKLAVPADAALVDGCCDPKFAVPTRCIVRGDGQSASIAAASVLAKVSRDRCMCELDREYPEYQFARHKGYPTRLHYEMILKYGVSPVHRRSFLRNLEEKRETFASR